MILATKDHLNCQSSDQDVLLFLDFDLGILGQSYEVRTYYLIVGIP